MRAAILASVMLACGVAHAASRAKPQMLYDHPEHVVCVWTTWSAPEDDDPGYCPDYDRETVPGMGKRAAFGR